MTAIYINSISGSDYLGSGTSSSPYKTISKAVEISIPGDVLVVTGADGHIHEEPDTVLLKDKLNLKLQIEPLRHITIRPLVTSGNAIFKIETCSNIEIMGFVFTNAPGAHSTANAVSVKDSSNIKIIGCEVSDAWKCGDVPASEMFKCDNSSVELTGNFCNYIENSYPTVNNPNNYFAFISLSGNGDYVIKNSAIKNVHSNSGYSYGVKIAPDCRKVLLDDFAADAFIPAHVDYKDKMIGVYIESDNSAVEFALTNLELNNLGYGILLHNAINNSKSFIKKAKITNCMFAGIKAEHNSILSSVRGLTIATCGHGIHVSNSSALSVYNTIVFKCNTALRCEIDSGLKLLYCVYYKNTQNKFENNRGIINTSQFVRNIDPRFVNEELENYNLTDYSPCVDTGKYFAGDAFLGNGPDIGYYEKSALVTEDELPSLLARATRRSELVPLTEIDIIGVISKGIETSDGRITASREGSAIRDVAVKPLDLLISPYHTELELIRDRLSFSKIEKLSEEDADLLAANVFVDRDYGQLASGILRVYFSEPTDAILYSEHEFKSNEGYVFYTRATIAITKDEMALNYDNGTYYLDAIIDGAVASESFNLPAFSIKTSTMPMPPGTLSFTNPYEITGGIGAETNYELKQKCRYGISVRDIVTKKGARAIMPELFPFITDMRVIGYRDPEMERDYIKLIDDHIGGKTDIYIKTRNPVIDSKIIYPESRDFVIQDYTFSGFVPILKIISIEILEPITEIPTGVFLEPNVQYRLLSVDSLTRFSVDELLILSFSEQVVADYIPATPFKINFEWVPEMKTLQSVIDGDDERTVVASIMAKCMEPVYVSLGISYLAEYEIEDLQSAIKGFITGLPNGKELQVSDIINLAYSLGAHKVLQPMELSIEHHDRYGNVTVTNSPDGVMIPRIATFWPGEITTTYLGREI